MKRAPETGRQAERTRKSGFANVYEEIATGREFDEIPGWDAQDRERAGMFGQTLCTVWGLYCLDGGPTMEATPETVEAMIRALGDVRTGIMKMSGTSDDGEVPGSGAALESAAIKMLVPAMVLWLSGWLDKLYWMLAEEGGE